MDRFVRDLSHVTYALESTPHVWGIGPDGTCKLAFVGEAPGYEETHAIDSTTGKPKLEPFIGPAGSLFTRGLTQAQIYRPGVWITNVVSVQPPKNDIHSEMAVEAIKAETEAFWEEIEYIVHRKGVRVIVALGETAAKAFGIQESISTIRGSIFEMNLNWRSPVTDPTAESVDFLLIPTYHPSYLLRTGRWYDRGKGKADLFLTFVSDLVRARELSEKPFTPVAYSFNLHPTIQDVEAFVEKATQSRSLVALDTETYGADRRIVMIGLALDSTSALVVPFLKKGGTEYWSPFDKPKVVQALSRLFQSCKFLFQNAPFDISVLYQNGFPFPPSSLGDDILLMHHAVHAELPHDLSYIASIYAPNYRYWKSTLKSKKRVDHILQIDDEEIRTYNAKDTCILHEIYPHLWKELQEVGEKTVEVYRNESLPLVMPVVQMMIRGVGYDRRAHKVWAEARLAELSEIEGRLRSTWKLSPHFDLNKELDMRYLLFGVVPATYKKHVEAEKKREGTKVHETLLKYRSILQDTQVFLRPKTFTPRTTDKTREIKLDKKNRISFVYGMVKRIQEIEALKRPTEEHLAEKAQLEAQIAWLQLYDQYSTIRTLLNTFSYFPNVVGDRVYPSYLIHGTATGRLSSRNPNAQNMPKKDKEFRRVFCAAKGYVLLSADYVNLEVGTLAYESGDPKLIEIFEKGLNLHDINTQIMFGITKDDPNWDACRRAAKIDQFGTQYGGGEREVYQNIITEVPNLRLSFEKYLEIRKRKFEAYPVFSQWYTSTMEKARATRRVETFMGRVRFLYGNIADIGKEGLNTPCQGAAAHIINRATIRIHRRLLTAKLDAYLIMQIHDQLVYEVREDQVDRVSRIIKEEMEWPIQFHGRKAVFPVEIEMGKNLAELQPLSLPPKP